MDGHKAANGVRYAPNVQIKPKPFVPQRRHVQSFIYPSQYDLLRHEMKTKLRNKLNYQFPMKSGQNAAMAAQPSMATLGADFDNSFIDTSNQA